MQMYANTLEHLLRRVPEVYSHFKGFFARDEVPTSLAEGEFFIGNTE